MKAYMVKAAREAKIHSSWLDPNADHERALAEFIDAILLPGSENGFLPDFRQFQEMIAYYGAISSLAQVLLKIVSPGVPDFYRGSELWDFGLVDPDNRRPVDFSKRARLQEELRQRQGQDLAVLLEELLARWQDGRVKLYLTSRALAFRRENADLFADGEYLALSAAGARSEHVVAFARRKGKVWALVAVPRLLAKLSPVGKPPLGAGVWGKDVLSLPRESPDIWLNVLTGEISEARPSASGRELPMHAVFERSPVALLSGTGV
jgi:(1->4)-alpha-D-glucan 1-alpha-D-glucosylmutase